MNGNKTLIRTNKVNNKINTNNIQKIRVLNKPYFLKKLLIKSK